LIEAEKAVFPVEMMCRALGVSRSGFYAWRSRPESKRTTENKELVKMIEEVHKESRKTYGSPRVHKELREQLREQGRRGDPWDDTASLG
jgi:putative transposase